eukprot:340101-Prymnesium_polylepis.2
MAVDEGREFTHEEWIAFGIKDLRMGHCVFVNSTCYYHPATEAAVAEKEAALAIADMNVSEVKKRILEQKADSLQGAAEELIEHAANVSIEEIQQGLSELNHGIASAQRRVTMSQCDPLRWKRLNQRPDPKKDGTGREIKNQDLAARVRGKAEVVFTKEELEQLQIATLMQPNSYVKSGPDFFQPARRKEDDAAIELDAAFKDMGIAVAAFSPTAVAAAATPALTEFTSRACGIRQYGQGQWLTVRVAPGRWVDAKVLLEGNCNGFHELAEVDGTLHQMMLHPWNHALRELPSSQFDLLHAWYLNSMRAHHAYILDGALLAM